MTDFAKHVKNAAQFCIRRAGTGNRDSTREFCNCIEHDEGEKVIAELVRRSHKNAKLRDGVRLMFCADSLQEIALRFGVKPLDETVATEQAAKSTEG